METEDRQKAYACDITYGNEQRVWVRLSPRQHALGGPGMIALPRSTASSRKGPLHFAIIDEVDNILNRFEARTPLIYLGPGT